MKAWKKWSMGLAMALLLLLSVVGVTASRVEYPLTQVTVRPESVRGVFHVHSLHSDGEGTIEEVSLAAKTAGLSFVVMTDHNPTTMAQPQYVNGVLIISAAEWSTPQGHLVGLGMNRTLRTEEREKTAFASIFKAGGKAVLAHPVQTKNPWRDWAAAAAADGYELYSGDTFWREALHRPTTLACVLGTTWINRRHAAASMLRSDEVSERKFLSLPPNKSRFIVCSQDAHGIPPYEWVFPLMSMHINIDRLPADAQAASELILNELFEERGLCVFDVFGDAGGFDIEGLSADRRVVVGGKLRVRLPPSNGATVRVRTTEGAQVLSDGVTVVAMKEGPFLLQVEILAPNCVSGADWKPWIVPNPIQAVR